jgi:hypothetical protein
VIPGFATFDFGILVCDEQGFVGWIETSAKEDMNVTKAMRFLIEHILALHDEEFEAPAQEKVRLWDLSTMDRAGHSLVTRLSWSCQPADLAPFQHFFTKLCYARRSSACF